MGTKGDSAGMAIAMYSVAESASGTEPGRRSRTTWPCDEGHRRHAHCRSGRDGRHPLLYTVRPALEARWWRGGVQLRLQWKQPLALLRPPYLAGAQHRHRPPRLQRVPAETMWQGCQCVECSACDALQTPWHTFHRRAHGICDFPARLAAALMLPHSRSRLCK